MTKVWKVLGIYREEKYSNRAIEADRAIMDSVLSEIKGMVGDEVIVSSLQPEQGIERLFKEQFDLIFTMAQSDEVLNALDAIAEKGTLVVNSSTAIRNCYRQKLSSLLEDEVFSYPKFSTLVFAQSEHHIFDSAKGYWLKRGDFHALTDDDVVFAKDHVEILNLIQQFKQRGVDSVILQENCEGELFKFYGVCDQFFNIRYIGKTTTDRYNNPHGNPLIEFDRNRLEKLAHMAARVLNLDYYGGDCIISPTGQIHFIDFNDWPSFRTCRNEVAPIMARYALTKLNSEVFFDRFSLPRI